MDRCIAQLNTLLSDLLDLSKLSAGVVEASVVDFPVAQVLEDLRSAHEPIAAAKGLRLHCVPAKFIVRTDAVLFQRIVGNFVDNAIRFTEAGGVVIGCRRRRGKVFLEVWDSGIGIPADKRTEIFDEFRQLGDGARNRGSGLGLAIAHKAATLLGLEVRVRSWPGRGSVFALEVPLGENKALSALPLRRDAARALRIVVVEDNVLMREAIEAAMRDAGHETVGATNSDELFAALGETTPDAVVSDYRLTGGVNGFEVVARLRARFGEQLPAIIITGDTDPALLRKMAEQGLVVMHKPIDVDALQVQLEDMANLAAEKNH